MQQTRYVCPKCQSENIQSFSMVYQTGITQNTALTTSETSGVFSGNSHSSSHGLSGKGIELSSENSIFEGTMNTTTNAASSGISVSHLASTCLPPTKPTMSEYKESTYLPGGGCGCIITLGIFIITIPTVIIPIAVIGFYIYKACLSKASEEHDKAEKSKAEAVARENELKAKQYQKELDEWNHSYLCMKCGNRFILDES